MTFLVGAGLIVGLLAVVGAAGFIFCLCARAMLAATAIGFIVCLCGYIGALVLNGEAAADGSWMQYGAGGCIVLFFFACLTAGAFDE